MNRVDQLVWNEQVFILNSNGAPFTFTRRPQFNVGGLVATLNVSDADFMHGGNLR
jgi:filamentous hemagglutinin family protein